ncbi:MAG TPA: hypothetical protein DCY13_10690 [Verrucomicrobiales bacterium]|nr:hypothetical protein [Verrucomicrobiales bacterium]
MNVVRANSRIRFTAEDVAFVLSVLAGEREEKALLELFFGDESSRDLILDDPALYEALTNANHCLPVSMPFYFYVLVRQVFLRAGIDDRSVADYVASLLVEFSRSENIPLRVPPDQSPIEYVFEMLAASARADERTRYFIQAHIGNHTLFLTGVFNDRIEHRARTRGFPGVGYYEGVGAGNFLAARDHRLARRHELVEVYDRLAGEFVTARRALNDLSDRLLHFGEPAWLSGFLGESSRLFN